MSEKLSNLDTCTARCHCRRRARERRWVRGENLYKLCALRALRGSL